MTKAIGWGHSLGKLAGVEHLAPAVQRHDPDGIGSGGKERLPLGALPLGIVRRGARPHRHVAHRDPADDAPAIVGADLLPARAVMASGPDNDELPGHGQPTAVSSPSSLPMCRPHSSM